MKAVLAGGEVVVVAMPVQASASDGRFRAWTRALREAVRPVTCVTQEGFKASAATAPAATTESGPLRQQRFGHGGERGGASSPRRRRLSAVTSTWRALPSDHSGEHAATCQHEHPRQWERWTVPHMLSTVARGDRKAGCWMASLSLGGRLAGWDQFNLVRHINPSRDFHKPRDGAIFTGRCR